MGWIGKRKRSIDDKGKQCSFLKNFYWNIVGLPRWLSAKKSSCQGRRLGFDPWVGKIPWSRKWQPTSVSLPGKFYGQRHLAGCSPSDHEELNTAERLSTHRSWLRSNVVFYCRARWVSRAHTCIPSLLDFIPTLVGAVHYVEFPVLYSRFSFIIYLGVFKMGHMCVYMCVLICSVHYSLVYPLLLSLAKKCEAMSWNTFIKITC